MEDTKTHPLGKFTREDCPSWLLIDGRSKTKKAVYTPRGAKGAENIGPALPHLISYKGQNHEGYTALAKAMGFSTRSGAIQAARRGYIGDEKIVIVRR